MCLSDVCVDVFGAMARRGFNVEVWFRVRVVPLLDAEDNAPCSIVTAPSSLRSLATEYKLLF